MALLLDNIPDELRPALLPVLERLVDALQPQGLWLFGSWARGSQSTRSDVDLLIEGLEGLPVLEAYDRVLAAIGESPLPIQPLVAAPSLLARHGDAPFWRSVKAEARPLLAGSVLPWTPREASSTGQPTSSARSLNTPCPPTVTAAPAQAAADSAAASAAALIAAGSDCTAAFRAAYENRYTWAPGFGGYRGRCVWEQGEQRVEGRFQVGADLKAQVEGIDNEEIHKAVASQLWEVAIHRVRRSFEQTHGENTFTAGDTDAVGTEVIVGGKNAGDRYRIKGDVVTMVHRHIHGTVVTIFTESTTDTGSGYLSRSYTSQYADPASGTARGGLSRFTDTFVPLTSEGPWVLSERVVETEAFGDSPAGRQVFRFEELAPLG